MTHSWLLIATTASASTGATPPRTPTKSDIFWLTASVIGALSLCLILLFVAMVLLRRHQHRVTRLTAAERSESEHSRRKVQADPWTESARRMDAAKVKEDSSDTVDFDPRELLAEDVWPPDDEPPKNGHGKPKGGGPPGPPDPSPPDAPPPSGKSQ